MFTLQATTISDAWFQLIYNIFDYGYRQNIQRGSFEKEQYRIQYPSVAVEILHPTSDIVPHIPTHLNLPAPTTQDYIDEYVATYLLSENIEKNETYTYGERINEIIYDHRGQGRITRQLQEVLDMLKKTPYTNQACIEIGKPSDIVQCIGNDGKLDPPCLRLIDFKVIPNDHGNFLDMHVYFRSWDLWGGFPTNLGGLVQLMEYVNLHIDNCVIGRLYAYSSGLHIYGYQEDIARIRTLRTVKNGTL